MSPLDVSVVVVSYETRDLTLAALASLRETAPAPEEPSHEVLVVDNASRDGSADAIAERFPEVRLLRQDRNLGFARANNLAAQEARGRLLVLLNPDTLVLPGALAALVRFADEHPEAGIVGGRTLFEDGTLNPTSCWARPTLWSVFCLGTGLSALFRRSRLFDPESMGPWPRDVARRVDIVSGCWMLVRRDLWGALGGFDEDFTMYGEDFDLCLRAEAAGASCWITPEAEIVHLGGRSETVRADKFVRLFSARARLVAKHWGPAASWFGVRMLDLWALSRTLALGVLRLVQPGRRDAYESWREVHRRRSDWRDAAAQARQRGHAPHRDVLVQ